jgi:hypothetical protein
MQFPPSRIVTVTNQKELDSAFVSTNRLSLFAIPGRAVPTAHHRLETLGGRRRRPTEVGAERPVDWASLLAGRFSHCYRGVVSHRLSGDRWKVTEQVSGWEVITKVRTPIRRQRAVAA